MPFSLTWWSFTFPVGTTVTRASELAAHTGSIALAWIAVALFLLLVGAWLTAAASTLRGSLAGGGPPKPHVRRDEPASPRT